MSAFPPHRSIPSIPVSQEIALKYLSAYLTAAKSTPYLQPNARLEQSGPTAGPSNSSVAMHNLQRVEAGLRGEWLAPVLDMEEGGVVTVAKGMDDGVPTGGESGEGDGIEWQDLEEYQREQEIEEGEGGDRMPGVVQEEGDDDAVDGFRMELEDVETGEKSSLKRKHEGGEPTKVKDKEARKAEKKARRKEESRAKNEAIKKKAESQ